MGWGYGRFQVQVPLWTKTEGKKHLPVKKNNKTGREKKKIEKKINKRHTPLFTSLQNMSGGQLRFSSQLKELKSALNHLLSLQMSSS